MQPNNARRLAKLLPNRSQQLRRAQRIHRLALAVLFASLLFG